MMRPFSILNSDYITGRRWYMMNYIFNGKLILINFNFSLFSDDTNCNIYFAKPNKRYWWYSRNDMHSYKSLKLLCFMDEAWRKKSIEPILLTFGNSLNIKDSRLSIRQNSMMNEKSYTLQVPTIDVHAFWNNDKIIFLSTMTWHVEIIKIFRFMIFKKLILVSIAARLLLDYTT